MDNQWDVHASSGALIRGVVNGSDKNHLLCQDCVKESAGEALSI